MYMTILVHTQLFDNFVLCNSQAKYYTKCFKNGTIEMNERNYKIRL